MTLWDKRCQLWLGTTHLVQILKQVITFFFFFNLGKTQCDASDFITQAREQLKQLSFQKFVLILHMQP